MTVDGTYAGAPAKVLWTGSENWANKSFWNDELTVQIPFAKAVRTYKKHFDYVWKSHTRRVGRQYARELDRFWARQRELRRLGRPTLLD
jgi:hypothetical protein